MTLILATLLALNFCLFALRETSSRRYLWFACCGVFAGLAISSKITGLAIWGLIFCLVAYDYWHNRVSLGKLFKRTGAFAVPAAAMILVGWVAHFSLITDSTVRTRAFAPQGSLFRDIARATESMVVLNSHTKATHKDASPAWTWPLMNSPIYYWKGKGEHIYFIGNPVLWASVALLYLIAILFYGLKYFRTKTLPPPGFLFVCFAYLASFVPYFFVSRVLFLYHYLSAFLFSLVAVCLFLEQAPFFQKHKNKCLAFGTAFAVIGFLSVVTLTYGFHLGSVNSFFLFQWLPQWR